MAVFIVYEREMAGAEVTLYIPFSLHQEFVAYQRECANGESKKQKRKQASEAIVAKRMKKIPPSLAFKYPPIQLPIKIFTTGKIRIEGYLLYLDPFVDAKSAKDLKVSKNKKKNSFVYVTTVPPNAKKYNKTVFPYVSRALVHLQKNTQSGWLGWKCDQTDCKIQDLKTAHGGPGFLNSPFARLIHRDVLLHMSFTASEKTKTTKSYYYNKTEVAAAAVQTKAADLVKYLRTPLPPEFDQPRAWKYLLKNDQKLQIFFDCLDKDEDSDHCVHEGTLDGKAWKGTKKEIFKLLKDEQFVNIHFLPNQMKDDWESGREPVLLPSKPPTNE